MQRTKDRQRVLAAHGALLSDERLPLAVTDFRETTHIEGRVLGHGQEEYSDRIYLMIEGMEGKGHFLYQTDEIQNARQQGQSRVNSFARIEKRALGERVEQRVLSLLSIVDGTNFSHDPAEVCGDSRLGLRNGLDRVRSLKLFLDRFQDEGIHRPIAAQLLGLFQPCFQIIREPKTS